MAKRRMFSLQIVDSDSFLAMPQSSRLLYYDLSMRADDDGFVDCPKKIMKMTGASDDDIKVLVGRQYIIPFNNGICVIKDWHIHNYIAGDRYHETKYIDEKKMLTLNENGTYSSKMYTKCIQNVDKLSTEVRLGKVRQGKVSLKHRYMEFVTLTTEEYFKLRTRFGRAGVRDRAEALNLWKGSKGKKTASDYLTILNWERMKTKDVKNVDTGRRIATDEDIKNMRG